MTMGGAERFLNVQYRVSCSFLCSSSDVRTTLIRTSRMAMKMQMVANIVHLSARRVWPKLTKSQPVAFAGARMKSDPDRYTNIFADVDQPGPKTMETKGALVAARTAANAAPIIDVTASAWRNALRHRAGSDCSRQRLGSTEVRSGPFMSVKGIMNSV